MNEYLCPSCNKKLQSLESQKKELFDSWQAGDKRDMQQAVYLKEHQLCCRNIECSRYNMPIDRLFMDLVSEVFKDKDNE